MNRFLLTITIILCFFGACKARPKPLGQPLPLALINGTVITDEHLRDRLNLEKSTFDEETLKDPTYFEMLRTKLLNQLVETRIITEWGKKEGFVLSNEDLAGGLAKIKKGYTDKAFETFLGDMGVSEVKWRDMMVEKFLAQKIIGEKVYNTIKVSEKEVVDYFGTHSAEFKTDERARVRHIVTDSPTSAEQLKRQLVAGENFAKVAIMNSLSPDRANGGDLGFITKGLYPAEFDEAIFKLEPGSLSQVVKSPYGYHIFKMIEKKPAGTLPIKEVAQRIYADLLKKKMTTAYQKWLADIREQIQVQMIDENIKKMKW